MYIKIAITVEDVDQELSRSNHVILVSLLYFLLFAPCYPICAGFGPIIQLDEFRHKNDIFFNSPT